MTKPGSPESPRLAKWLIEKFSGVLDNDSLVGDLNEAFKEGRSSGWYWRQVSVAIFIALGTLLRRNLVRFGFAVGCGLVFSVAWFFMFPAAGRGSAFPWVFALFAKGYGLEWPWSLLYQIAFLTAFQAATAATAIVLYLAFSRTLQPQRLLGALPVVVFVLVTSNVVCMFLGPVAGSIAHGLPVGWIFSSAPPTIALFLGKRKAGLAPKATPVSS